MNIYQHKFTYKLVLLAIAVVIAGATLWYTNNLAARIAQNERAQVKLWAEAIENKASLVRYTNKLFDRLSNGERQKVSEWAEAIKLVISTEDNNALTFATDIIAGNENIPVILVSGLDSTIRQHRNVYELEVANAQKFEGEVAQYFSKYPPIPVYYEFQMEPDLIYYNDSKLFKELKQVLNDLIESFISEIVINSASVPVVYTDAESQLLAAGNIDTTRFEDSAYYAQKLVEMAKVNEPLTIDLGEGFQRLVYYENSETLNRLKYYPFVQLGIISAFLFLSYLAFSSSRKAEQNQVWVGLAKETAHQLGTPISSLSAWLEYIKETDPADRGDMNVVAELEKDVERLSLVADRFSKIGSQPELESKPLNEVVQTMITYMSGRASKKVQFSTDFAEGVQAKLNVQLFEWVLENLIKNALDAIEGAGAIEVLTFAEGDKAVVEISDSGKGIPTGKQQAIFQPGYSTKKRGWGLGLSLSKRIVESYHGGKIFVKQTTPKGTVFRIELKKGA